MDPASSDKANEIVKAKVYYTKKDSGLEHDWGGRIWLNPPYASDLIGLFITKYADTIFYANTEGIVLVNNATETGWFKDLVSVSDGIVFTYGRVKFLDPQGNPGAPLQGQAIVYAGPNVDSFFVEFERFGWKARL